MMGSTNEPDGATDIVDLSKTNRVCTKRDRRRFPFVVACRRMSPLRYDRTDGNYNIVVISAYVDASRKFALIGNF